MQFDRHFMFYHLKIRHLYSLICGLLILTLMSSSTNQATPDIGDAAPDFTLENGEGTPLNLKNLKGRITLIDFWASWCNPCRAANQELKPMYERYSVQGFEIISISIDKHKDAWIQALNKDQLLWPGTVHDAQAKVSEMYGVEYLPYTYLIDENGIVLDKDFDPLDLEPSLRWYFEEQPYFYPSTSSSKITFTDKVKYEVLDKNGKTVLKGKDEVVDISGIADGTYQVDYEGKKETLKKVTGAAEGVEFFPVRADKTIKLSGLAYYEIRTSKGGFILKGKGTSIDVSKLPADTYKIIIDGKEGTFLKK